MALQHQKHDDDWYNKQLKDITELYASSRQAINGPSLKCESSKHPLRIMLQFITASIAHFEVEPPASKFATVIYTLSPLATHMKILLFKLRGYLKIYLTLNL